MTSERLVVRQPIEMFMMGVLMLPLVGLDVLLVVDRRETALGPGGLSVVLAVSVLVLAFGCRLILRRLVVGNDRIVVRNIGRSYRIDWAQVKGVSTSPYAIVLNDGQQVVVSIFNGGLLTPRKKARVAALITERAEHVQRGEPVPDVVESWRELRLRAKSRTRQHPGNHERA